VASGRTRCSVVDESGLRPHRVPALVLIGRVRFATLEYRDERREVSLTEFSAADGTKFNAMFNKPKVVRVKAHDVSGKTYDVGVPWR